MGQSELQSGLSPGGKVIVDVYGRKTALVLSLLLMALSTVGIGLVPSYESIGIAAP